MKGESLEHILNKKLRDFESAEPIPSWQQMQRRMELHANAHPEIPRKHNLFLKRLSYSAAVAAVLLVLSIGGYRLSRYALESDPESLHIQPISEAGLAKTSTLGDPVLTRLLQNAKTIEVITVASNTSLPMLTASMPMAQTPTSTHEETTTAPMDPGTTTQQQERNATTSSSQQQDADIASYRRLFNTPEKPHRRWPRSKWSTAAFANTSTFSTLSGNHAMAMKLTALSTGNNTIPAKEQALSFNPNHFLNHKFPISVGLNVRKYITPRLGIETGLVYSFLESEAELEGAFNYHYNQKVHYLGIPLSLTYSVLDNKRFDIYFIGGFMAEKAISAHGTTKIHNGSTHTSTLTNELPASGLFWSAHLGTGFGYNFVDRMGLYVEPEVNYYFRNDNQPTTYRSANPWNINIRMGLRYNF